MSCLLLYSCILVPTISISALCNLLASSSISIAPLNIIILSFFNPWHQSRSFFVNSHWVFVLGPPPPPLRFFVYDKECGWICIAIPYPDGIPLHARIFKPIQGTTRQQELHHLITHCYASVLQYRCILNQNWLGGWGMIKVWNLRKLLSKSCPLCLA